MPTANALHLATTTGNMNTYGIVRGAPARQWTQKQSTRCNLKNDAKWVEVEHPEYEKLIVGCYPWHVGGGCCWINDKHETVAKIFGQQYYKRVHNEEG